MLRDALGSMMHHMTGTPKTRAQNQRDFDVMMKERLAKARKLREERARKKGSPAVGALLGDATWVGPPPPKD